MQWLEIVRVRIAGNDRKNVEARLAGQLGDIKKLKEAPAVRMYTHTVVPNDLMILLTWQTRPPEAWGSDLAHTLINEMKKFGLVDHSMWMEKTAAE